jgi:hypothetical protein
MKVGGRCGYGLLEAVGGMGWLYGGRGLQLLKGG